MMESYDLAVKRLVKTFHLAIGILERESDHSDPYYQRELIAVMTTLGANFANVFRSSPDDDKLKLLCIQLFNENSPVAVIGLTACERNLFVITDSMNSGRPFGFGPVFDDIADKLMLPGYTTVDVSFDKADWIFDLVNRST